MFGYQQKIYFSFCKLNLPTNSRYVNFLIFLGRIFVFYIKINYICDIHKVQSKKRGIGGTSATANLTIPFITLNANLKNKSL